MQIIHTHCHSLEQHRLASAGYDFEVCQLSPGEILGAHSMLLFDHMHLLSRHVGQDLLEQGAMPAGVSAFNFIGSKRCMHFSGVNYSPASLSSTPEGCEFRMLAAKDSRYMTIALIESTLPLYLDEQELSQYRQLLAGVQSGLCVDSQRQKRITLNLLKLFNGLCSGTMLLSTLMRQDIQDHLITACVDLLIDSQPISVRLNCQHKLLARALEYVDTSDLTTLSVSSWVAGLATSRRSLESVFSRHLGLTPKRYLIVRRLGEIREKLLAGHGKNIKLIAQQFGVAHMGHFSRDYRLHFGELPSVTFARNG